MEDGKKGKIKTKAQKNEVLALVGLNGDWIAQSYSD
jgi:hypothetical protein